MGNVVVAGGEEGALADTCTQQHQACLVAPHQQRTSKVRRGAREARGCARCCSVQVCRRSRAVRAGTAQLARAGHRAEACTALLPMETRVRVSPLPFAQLPQALSTSRQRAPGRQCDDAQLHCWCCRERARTARGGERRVLNCNVRGRAARVVTRDFLRPGVYSATQAGLAWLCASRAHSDKMVRDLCSVAWFTAQPRGPGLACAATRAGRAAARRSCHAREIERRGRWACRPACTLRAVHTPPICPASSLRWAALPTERAACGRRPSAARPAPLPTYLPRRMAC